MKIWQKIIAVVSTFALLLNSLAAPLSVLAQTVDETPSPAPEFVVDPLTGPEATATPEVISEATATPEATPDATPAETPTVLPESTPAVTDLVTPTQADVVVETQAPESNPTVQGPPASETMDSASPTILPTAQPTETPIETGKINATILENTTIDTSALDEYDLSYQTDGSAVIVTDKADYSPYDTAFITGSGFIAGKTYQLTVSSEDYPATSTTVNITADNTGKIMYAYELDHTYRPNYSVVVKDGERVVAETTFTDGGASATGNVKDAGTLLTISGATVTCSSGCNSPASATTNGSGMYTLSFNFSGNSNRQS
jgi:hypothetical protein